MINKEEIYQIYLKTKSFQKTVKATGCDPAVVKGALQSRGINLAGQGIYRKAGEVASQRHVVLGASIAMLRLEKGFTESADFAKMSGMSPKKLTMIEQGRRDAVFSDLLRIADALNTPIVDLMQRVTEEEKKDAKVL